MDYVETGTGMRHAGTVTGNAGQWKQAETLCGRTVTAVASGACIAPMIECKRCRKVMRGNGWKV